MAWTYWPEIWLGVKDKIMEDLAAIVDDRGDAVFHAVYFGKKAQPKEFPCAIVRSEAIRTRSTTVRSSQYPMVFDIRVIAKSEDPDEGVVEVVGYLGMITKLFEDDRQWGGWADTVEPYVIIPEVERRAVRTRHEGSIVTTFMRYVLPQ